MGVEKSLRGKGLLVAFWSQVCPDGGPGVKTPECLVFNFILIMKFGVEYTCMSTYAVI